MASLFAIRVASGGRAVHPTDIGCYSLGSQPPLSVGDVMMCMGASAGISCGISKVLKEPVVAIVGDSTFFHGAIPGLINAVYNYHKFVYVVLDNSTAAMTGFQPNPGTGVTAMGRTTKRVLAEDIARACGVDFVRVADPFDIKSAIAVLKQAMNFGGPSLVVFRKPCAVLEGRERRRRGEGTVPFEVDPTKCTACYACIKLLGCPPLKSEENRVEVDPLLCVGCGLCAQICPFQAIRRRPS